jgi:hypothetical protein
LSHPVGMLVSAELRWFWPEIEPVSVRDWFENGGIRPGGGLRSRHDDYYFIAAGQTTLGIKWRDAQSGTPTLEIKSLVSKLSAVAIPPFEGEPGIWVKCQVDADGLPEGPAFRVGKRRWLRKFSAESADLREIKLDQNEKPDDAGSLPVAGCNVEFTEVQLPKDLGRHWTLGFEAFGAADDVQNILKRTLAHTVSRGAPVLAGAFAASYPEWLSRFR